MKIENSDVFLKSAYASSAEHVRFEKLQIIPAAGRKVSASKNNNVPAILLSVPSPSTDNKLHIKKEDLLTTKIKILEILLELVTGKKVRIKVINPSDIAPRCTAPQNIPVPANPNEPGFIVRYEYFESYKEAEAVSFSAKGVIQTGYGKQIDFEVSFSLSREFVTEQNIVIQNGKQQPKDPLVVNFDGLSANLATSKIKFDIDGDGIAEQISFVSPGSGFLALDQNKDGVINNGLELFGPETGNGFLELAAYDSDNNMWIDENDAIFSSLLIWMKDSEGKDYLHSLKEKDVGAIYIGNISTKFVLRDTSTINGEIKSSSIYLKEDGSPGTIQHIDLVA